MASPCEEVESVIGRLHDSLSKLGFEVYPLKIGWYNAVLSPSLHLTYPEDTLAVVVISTPAMFEQVFLPFMEKKGYNGVSDPIDQSIKDCISCTVSQCFPEQKLDVSYDYEMLPNRKPKFLAQTAAHVSGATYYYQQDDVTDQPWGEKKMFGVCVHPRYGGWFAIRALLVFDGVDVGSEMVQPVPPDCVPSREDRIQLLEGFNLHWREWSYRDIIPAVQTYSQRQMDYFSTTPAKRLDLLRAWGLLPDKDSQPEPPTDAQSLVDGQRQPTRAPHYAQSLVDGHG